MPWWKIMRIMLREAALSHITLEERRKRREELITGKSRRSFASVTYLIILALIILYVVTELVYG